MRHYLVCDYFATGEGVTKCLMIDTIYPQDGKQIEDLVYKRFSERFGGYYAQGLESLTEEEFFRRFKHFVPDVIKKLHDDPSGMFAWDSMIHVNYS